MRKGLGISGMKRPGLGVGLGLGRDPGTSAQANIDGGDSESQSGSLTLTPTLTPTNMARRGIAISGGARRLGISGMNRPLVQPLGQQPLSTDDTDGELLP